MRRNFIEECLKAYKIYPEDQPHVPIVVHDGSVTQQALAGLGLINISTGRGTIDFEEEIRLREENSETLALLRQILQQKP